MPMRATQPKQFRRPFQPWIGRCALVAPLLLFARAGLVAQVVGTLPLTQIGSETEERARLNQIMGHASTAGFLIRTMSRSDTTSVTDTTDRMTVAVLLPEYRAVYNSGIPYSLNDGAMWAGRGWNQALTGGVVLRSRNFRLILDPTLLSEQNRDFQVIQFNQFIQPQRSIWANPFHPRPESVDLPLRFGDRSIRRLDFGQSSLEVTYGPVAIGAGTENNWWGPGIRTAIVLSNNAPGFPHVYLQTVKPVHTRVGIIDAKWILGQLSESGFFDFNSHNNGRPFAGIVGVWQPGFDTTLSVGFSRVAMASHPTGGFLPFSAFDVFRKAFNPPDSAGGPPRVGRDGITSFFARWVLPKSGAEVYGEWARFAEPSSFHDFLESPGHSEAYVVGLQWAHRSLANSLFRLQSEFSYLEPDPSLRLRPGFATYTSPSVLQGFTNQGQTLGAATGPASSSQWLAGDLFANRWRFGLFVNRIRWDNAALYEPVTPSFRRQDVTMSAGLRGSKTLRGLTVFGSFEHATRFNYLYQSYIVGPTSYSGIDLVNNTLSIGLSATPWQ